MRHPRVQIGGTTPTTLLRRCVRIEHVPSHVPLRLFVDGVYHLWVNDHYIARGPAMHHPMHRPFDTHDLAPHLRAGDNCIAILTHTPDFSIHNYVPTTEPSMIGTLDLPDQQIAIDESWRVCNRTGWSRDVPRRSWALGYIEHFDATQHPTGWRSPDYDDSAWSAATVYPSPAVGVTDFDRPTPLLRYGFASPRIRSVTTCTHAPIVLTADMRSSVLGNSLLALDRSPVESPVEIADRDGAIVLRNLSPDRGVVISFELDQQHTGQFVFQCDSTTAGTIDIGYSETSTGDLPTVVRKGVGYCDRVVARAGTTDWQPISYSSMRYMMLVLRGFSGDVTLRNVGIRTSEPDLACDGTFESDHARDNDIFELCVRSHFVGTQEAMLDCPTREQAAYIGDGVLTGRWLTMLTGDTRLWAHIIEGLFTRPYDTGLLPSAIFSGAQSALVDYTLLAIIGLRDYWRYTRDDAMVSRHLPACRRALAYLEQFSDRTGLFDHTPHGEVADRGWEAAFDTAHPRPRIAPVQRLFIDHPGMGWHNINEPGIDRNGISCAYNALIVQTWRAMVDLERVAGVADTGYASKADALARLIHDTFFDTSLNLYVDAIKDGLRSSQISEHTNTWAIAAGCCDRDRARTILSTLMRSTDPALCRAGPYFWAYIYPQLTHVDEHQLALEQTRVCWAKMLDGGATTLWETFAGDDLDSWCHAWSGAPIEFYLTGVAGLPGLELDESNLILRPRPDLVPTCRATTHTRVGPVSIAWRSEGKTIHLSGTLPDGIRATLALADRPAIDNLTGAWRVSV